MQPRLSFPIEFTDTHSGARLRGDLVVADDWSAGLDDPGAGNDFRIVVLTRPQAVTVHHAAVAALLPGAAVVGQPQVAEQGPGYSAGQPAAVAVSERGPDIDRSLVDALRRGRVVAATIDVDPEDLFGPGGPGWQALALRLVRPSAEAVDPTRRALTMALDRPAAEAEAALLELTQAAMRVTDGEPPSAEVADDVYCLRAWLAHPEATRELLRMRSFLREADVADEHGDLALDRAITREQISFGALLAEPDRITPMRASFEYFERRYRAVYGRHHRFFREQQERLAEEMEPMRERARALRQLNTIEGLGAPLGLPALEGLDRLASEVGPCGSADLPPPGAALCPQCRVSLAAGPPRQLAADLGARIGRALERQQARLAAEAVRRILSKGADDPSGRLDRFLRVVQASDLTGLANVLDDDLVAFLRALLADAPPHVELAPVLGAIAERFPEVTQDDLDTVVDAFRQALREALDGGQGGTSATSKPTIR